MSLSITKNSSAKLDFTSLKWSQTPEAIKALQEQIVRDSTAVLDAVAAAGAAGGASLSWEKIAGPLIKLDRDFEPLSAVTFLKDVATEKSVRDASAAAQAALSAFEVKAGMRVDVFEAVKALHAKVTAEGSLASWTPEARRFLERTLRDFKRKGLDLPADKRAEVEALQTEISNLCTQFQVNLGEWSEKLYFTEEELKGMPADFVKSLKRVDAATANTGANVRERVAAGGPECKAPAEGGAEGTDVLQWLEVELNYPHVVPLTKLCSVPATRAAVEKAFNSRAHPANTKILERVAVLRARVAGLLGYDNHNHYTLEDKMAGSPKTVADFLGKLAADLRPLHEADLASLLQRKKAEEGEASGPITMADYRYYMEKELLEKYSVDHDAIKQYFPLETVVQGTVHIYQRLFGIEIKRVQAPAESPLWHAEAELYEVREASPEAAAEAGGAVGQVLGHFALDLHPREGKYSHAAVFPLLAGCEAGEPNPAVPSSERNLPFAAMLCNFPRSTAEKPALLPHGEVTTFLHELGHVFHHMLSRTRFHRFSSFRCESDFVEAPSQMLENYTWLPATLQMLSGHWQDRSKVLPLELAEKLAVTRKAHAGLFNTRQIFLASFDQRLHGISASHPAVQAVTVELPAAVAGAGAAGAAAAAASVTVAGEDAAAAAEAAAAAAATAKVTVPEIPSEANTELLLQELHSSILNIPMTPGSNFAANFGHMCGGYSSLYFGYLWSEVFAADMFDSVLAKDPLSTAAGLRYRKHIVGNGGAVDAKDFLRDFLGREPSNEAFLRQKGLC